MNKRIRSAIEQRPAVLGYLIAGTIFTVLIFGLSFSHTSDSRQQCEQVNDQFGEVNERVDDITGLRNSLDAYMLARLDGDRSKIAEGVPAIRTIRILLRTVQPELVTLRDCDEAFPNPWPFD